MQAAGAEAVGTVGPGHHAGKGAAAATAAKSSMCEEKGGGRVAGGGAIVGAFVPPTDGGKTAPFDIKSFGFMGPTTTHSECVEPARRKAGGHQDVARTPRGGVRGSSRGGVGTPRDTNSMATIMSMGLPFGGGGADVAPALAGGKGCAPTLARSV